MADLVAFVESYPHVMAGQQHTLLSLLEESRTVDIAPMLIAPGKGICVEHVRSLGVPAKVIPYPHRMSRYGGQVYRDGHLDRVRLLLDWVRYTLSCRRELKKVRPEAIFCNDLRGLLTVGVAGKSLGIPIMIWDKLDKPHGILDWFQLPIADQNIIISKSVMRKYPKWQARWYRDRISQIFDGTSLGRIDAGHSIRGALGIPEDCIVIGIVGTVTHRKGHDRLLRIVPELVKNDPRIRILIVGSWQDTERDLEYYRLLENRDHPHVMFLGHFEEVENIMHSIDILTIPSRHEGLGLVTIEAMAAGKPTVGANIGGIPEVIVDGETGFVFDGEDRDGYLQCLLRLCKSKVERDRMGRAGRRRVEEHFNRPVLMSEVCEKLKKMTQESR